MEWVETTGRTLEEAKEAALDQLGVVAEDAEFTILAEPKQGLFGRLRGEARVRARVRPAPVRPKQDRRRGGRRGGNGSGGSGSAGSPAGAGSSDAGADTAATSPPGPSEPAPAPPDTEATSQATTTVTHDAPTDSPEDTAGDRSGSRSRRRRGGRGRRGRPQGEPGTDDSTDTVEGAPMTTDDASTDRDPAADQQEPPEPSAADVEAVRTAALGFVEGLTGAFGFDAEVTAVVEGSEIEVRVNGPSLGLLIGPGGRTLLAIQDLTRVAAQRRLGDHDTRLRVDVAGYRERRREALVRFAATVAQQVKESGIPRSLDPMPSADRKILHDVLATIDGVTSRSEGEDPYRRVVVTPA